MKNNKIKHAMTAAPRYMMSCTWALTLALALASSTNAQDRIIRVDIANGSLTGDGQDWEQDSVRFLQDALAMADDYLIGNPTHTVEIWVASAYRYNLESPPQLVPYPYRPDQSKNNDPGEPGCNRDGDCDKEEAFDLRNNVRILGGFPSDPHTLHGGQGATIDDRDPALHETILSGDLRHRGGQAASGSPAAGPAADVVAATDVDATATIDGFTIRGGIALRRSQPRIRDCTIELPEDAAVVCHDASHASFQRCTFALHHGESIIIQGTSRVELLLCEPAAALSDLQRCGQTRVGESSQLLIVDQAMWDAAMARSAADGEDQSGESATGTSPKR